MGIVITQGDALTLTLTCTGHDLTAATMTTAFEKTDGTYLSIANGSHTIDADQSANPGKFTLPLTAANTALIKAGVTNIVTRVVQGSVTRHFHGISILTTRTQPLG